MVTAKRVGDKIELRTEYRDKELVRQVPGARWSPEDERWYVPLSWVSCVSLRGVFRERLEVLPDLVDWAREELRTRVEPSLARRAATVPLDGEAYVGLFPFQKAGVEWLHVAQHALLADEMGAGKSVQTVTLLKSLDLGPTVVVCPNSVKGQWEDEFGRWWPEASVHVVGGSAAKRRKALETPADVYVLNWESVRLHSRLAPYGSIRLKRCPRCGGHDDTVTPAKCETHAKELQMLEPLVVVADEAHRMKDPKAKQTRAVWALGHQPSVQLRLALTGTPIANAPDDLWSLLHFLEPKEWPTRTRYIDRYCLQSWSPFGGTDVIGIRPEADAEFRRAFEPRFRRMPKALVLDQLPPKVRETRKVLMNSKQAKAYKQMDDSMVVELDEELIVAPNTLARALRMMQFASAYATVNEQGKLILGEPSSKLDALDEILEDLGGAPVVVFALSRQLIMLAHARLEKRRIPHRLLVGGLSDEARQHLLRDFANGKADILLVTIQAGGEGLNLTRAGHAVFLQRSWSMLQNRQAEDRIHRIGSEMHDSVHIVDVVTPDTIEEEQISRLRIKFERLEEIVRDRERLKDDPNALARLEAEAVTIEGGTLL